jgi:flagellar biosynthetic protein FliP
MKSLFYFTLSFLLFSLSVSLASAQSLSALGLPAITASDIDGGGTTYSLSLQILLLMTILTVLPSLVLGMTAFTRIIIVLSILRQALGTQQTPPNQVLIAVALFLSFFIMGPVFEVLYRDAISPFLDGRLDIERALVQGLGLLKEFMVANTRSDTLNLFVDLSKSGPFENEQSVPLNIVLPAFITSELKTAFEIGFLIFLPFLVIDMVIASILMSLGMMMLSPMLISLPFKLLLFVLVDGWAMTIGSLSATFMV